MSRNGIIAVVVFMLAPVVLVIGGCAAWIWTPASFTVRNESGQVISLLKVETYGNEPCVFENIPPGGKVTGTFRVNHENSLVLDGVLADGTKISDSFGYVVWEDFAPHIDVIVRQDGGLGP